MYRGRPVLSSSAHVPPPFVCGFASISGTSKDSFGETQLLAKTKAKASGTTVAKACSNPIQVIFFFYHTKLYMTTFQNIS